MASNQTLRPLILSTRSAATHLEYKGLIYCHFRSRNEALMHYPGSMRDTDIRTWFGARKGQAVCGRVAARNLERSSLKKRFYEWTRIAADGSLLVSAAACDRFPFSGTETVGEISLPSDSIHQIDSSNIRPVPQPTHQLGAPLVSDSLPD